MATIELTIIKKPAIKMTTSHTLNISQKKYEYFKFIQQNPLNKSNRLPA